MYDLRQKQIGSENFFSYFYKTRAEEKKKLFIGTIVSIPRILTHFL